MPAGVEEEGAGTGRQEALPAAGAAANAGDPVEPSWGDDEQPADTEEASLGNATPPADAAVAPPRAHRWGRQLAVASLYTIGILGAGVVLGWVIAGRTIPPVPEQEIVEVPIIDPAASDVTMPDVRGLTESNARTALTDAGIPADRITVTTRPAAGAPGVVVTQDPAYGTAKPTAVALTVSTEAAVPDLVGMPEAEASSELLALGARVEVAREYDPNTDPGLVLASTPKPGSPIKEAVTLTVAQAPGSVYLTQLSTIDGSNRCSTTTSIIAGQQYDQSLVCSADTEATDYTWLLAGKVTRFDALIGVPDDGDRDASATVEILVDGTRKATGNISYTKPLSVSISAKGGTQLTVRLTRPPDPNDSWAPSTDVVIADGRLVGSTDQISQLAGWAQQ